MFYLLYTINKIVAEDTLNWPKNYIFDRICQNIARICKSADRHLNYDNFNSEG